jgi:hypothetical protein
MAVETIWVVAESFDGKALPPHPGTAERRPATGRDGRSLHPGRRHRRGRPPTRRLRGDHGKTVKPTVYLAAGISGATQHMVGMKGAKNIIAISKDQEAPIFSVADLGVVGDVHKVLPKLIEALQSRS